MPRRWLLGLAGLLLVALLAQLGLAAVSDGLTYDELAYIACGYRHLVTGDYRQNFEQPPLAKLASALPLLWLQPSMPEWLPDDNFWAWSRRFVHEQNDAGQLIPAARVVPVLLTLALSLLVFVWARSALGDVAAVAALAMLAFHPSLLAHGHLATTDMATALAMTGASWAFWRWRAEPGAARACFAALCFGAAVVTRLTGWLLLPPFAVLLLGHAERGSRAGARHLVQLFLAFLVIVPCVIWASYRFRFAPWPGASLHQEIGLAGGLAGRVLLWLEHYRALPEAYLAGMAAILGLRESFPAYLLGQVSPQGWRSYYVVAFLVKNTPGFLMLLLLGFCSWLRQPALGPGRCALHWALPAGAVFATASLMRVQIGERYILAIYAYLILLLGAAAARLWRGRAGRWALGICVVLHAGAGLRAAANGYLAYFNDLAGGRDGADRVLLDSNLDWGQDLPRLAEWMRREGVDRVQLGYFGRDDPNRHGIRHRDLPGSHSCRAGPPRHPLSGVVVVSPNLLKYLAPAEAPYASLLERTPDARVGALRVYRLPNPLEDPRTP